jgi:hypothetical protein
VNVLLLGIAVTAVLDLRRLQTPGGTALVWAQSAVFGECGDYVKYSVPDPSVPDERSTTQLCQDLRAATATARGEPLKVGLILGRVQRAGNRARVELVLTRAGVSTRVAVRLASTGGRWRVVRDALTCGSLGCA